MIVPDWSQPVDVAVSAALSVVAVSEDLLISPVTGNSTPNAGLLDELEADDEELLDCEELLEDDSELLEDELDELCDEEELDSDDDELLELLD